MTSIRSIVDKYLEALPSERDRLRQLCLLLEECDQDADLISRDNHIGHITASGFIISSCRTKVLLLRHKKLDMWLQPGGHITLQDATPLAAACREIEEETGFTKIDYLAYHYDDIIPIDIDTHRIAATAGVPSHFHHDFRYAFLSDLESRITLNADEFHEYKWNDLNELLRYQTYALLKGKLEQALSGEFRPKIFFDRLLHDIAESEPFDALVVTHLLPDARVYLRTLDKVSARMTIIPKPRSIDRDVLEATARLFTIQETTRERLQEDQTVEAFIQNAAGKVVLFDIGGYFAPIVNRLKDAFREKLLGVVEDTENGHQKYEAQSPLKLPVISVARSPLKDNEDFLVGQSVLFSADAVLREVGKLIQYLTCSVLGFGKIGNSIAHHLLARGVKPSVFDVDPIRRMSAGNRLYNIPAREHIIRTSDVIFCATGSQVLNINDFRALKPGCAVFSVTSSDDEMDLRHLDGEYQLEDVTKHVTRCSSASNHFFLINRGNAVNFIHKAALGDFIHIVRAEMILAASLLANSQFGAGLHSLDSRHRSKLAELWLSTFVDEPTTLRDFKVIGV